TAGLVGGRGTLTRAAGTAEASSAAGAPLSDAVAAPLASLADTLPGSGERPRTGTAPAEASAALSPRLMASGSGLTGIGEPLPFMTASICVFPDEASDHASAAPPSPADVADGGTAGLGSRDGLPASSSE